MEQQVITLLDELAWLVSETDDGPRLPALRAAVVDLEDLAQAPLGEADDEPAAVLHRRFARAHRLLLRTQRAGIAERLELLIQTLEPQRPPAAPATGTEIADPSTAPGVVRRAERESVMSRAG